MSKARDHIAKPERGELLVGVFPSADDEPRPVRLIGPDGRVLETVGALDTDDRRSARVEIDPAFLRPGRYVVEMKTTERSHFPLRRYALEVR